MKHNKKRLLVALLELCYFSGAYAGAQLPNTVQPGRIEKDIKSTPRLPVPSETITVPKSEPQQMPAEAASISFVLKGVVLSGNTVFSKADIQTEWKDLIGKEVKLADIFELAKKLTTKYRDAGYILSQVIVPVQEIQSGEVKLQVIEGFIDKIEIRSSNEALQARLIKHLEPIKSEKPLTGKTLERYLLLLNDIGNIQANGYLQSSSTPNATDLIVTVAQDRFSGSIGAHNRVSEIVGNVQFDGSLNFNDIFGLLENHNVRALTTNTGDLALFNYGGSFPIGVSGLSFQPSFGYSKNKPDIGSNVNLESTSKTGAFMLSYPVIRSREKNLSVRTGLSLFNSETELNGLKTDEFKLRTLRVGAVYDQVDALRGVNQVDIEVSRGIKGLGAKDDLAANGDNLSFTKTTLYFARLQSLSPNWSLLAAFNGQHTNDILLSPERFGLGGESFLRGFDPSELLGDSGMAGKLELRYNFAVQNIGMTAYTLAETGKVWIHNFNQPDQTDHASSIGVGLRFSALNNINGYIELDKPLGRDVATKGDRDARLFANVVYSF